MNKNILSIAGYIFLSFHAQAQKNNFDYRILRQLSEHRTESKDHFFKTISDAASYVDYSLPAALFISGSFGHDRPVKQKAVIILESQLVSAALTYGTKHIINRKRPSQNDPTFIPVVYESSPSFPSGHTSEAFATATAITIAYPKWYVIVPAYSWAVMVGYSRVYLGVHYPTDVIAGAVLGSGCAFLTYKINQWWQKRQQKLTANSY